MSVVGYGSGEYWGVHSWLTRIGKRERTASISRA